MPGHFVGEQLNSREGLIRFADDHVGFRERVWEKVDSGQLSEDEGLDLLVVGFDDNLRTAREETEGLVGWRLRIEDGRLYSDQFGFVDEYTDVSTADGRLALAHAELLVETFLENGSEKTQVFYIYTDQDCGCFGVSAEYDANSGVISVESNYLGLDSEERGRFLDEIVKGKGRVVNKVEVDSKEEIEGTLLKQVVVDGEDNFVTLVEQNCLLIEIEVLREVLPLVPNLLEVTDMSSSENQLLSPEWLLPAEIVEGLRGQNWLGVEIDSKAGDLAGNQRVMPVESAGFGLKVEAYRNRKGEGVSRVVATRLFGNKINEAGRRKTGTRYENEVIGETRVRIESGVRVGEGYVGISDLSETVEKDAGGRSVLVFDERTLVRENRDKGVVEKNGSDDGMEDRGNGSGGDGLGGEGVGGGGINNVGVQIARPGLGEITEMGGVGGYFVAAMSEEIEWVTSQEEARGKYRSVRAEKHESIRKEEQEFFKSIEKYEVGNITSILHSMKVEQKAKDNSAIKVRIEELVNELEVEELTDEWVVNLETGIVMSQKAAAARMANRVADWLMGVVGGIKMHYGFIGYMALCSLIDHLGEMIHLAKKKSEGEVKIPVVEGLKGKFFLGPRRVWADTYKQRESGVYTREEGSLRIYSARPLFLQAPSNVC